MTKIQYPITKSLRNRYKTVISTVEEEYDMHIIAIRKSIKGNYILVGDLEEVCINKQNVNKDVKILFNVIISNKINKHIKKTIENIYPIELSLTLSMKISFQPLLIFMQQHFSPQPIFDIQKISYDNKDIICYGIHDSISLSKSTLQEDNSMFEALFELLMDEKRRDDKDEFKCILYLFKHGQDIISFIQPNYKLFIGMTIKKLIYENHELKLPYSFCSRSFKAKMSQKELIGLFTNEHVENDIANILIHEIDKKMLGYKEKYNNYTKSFVDDNESYLILQYLNNIINEHFNIPLKIGYQDISFDYQGYSYEADYQILKDLSQSFYSIKKEEIYSGFYNYHIVIDNEEKMNQYINFTISKLSSMPFMLDSYDNHLELSKIDIEYNNIANLLINGLHKQGKDKPKYKLLNDLEAIYEKINYGICCNGHTEMSYEIELIMNDSTQLTYQEASTYLYSVFDDLDIDSNMISHIKGKGLLYGKTSFDYGDVLLKESYTIDGGCYKDNFNIWCQHIFKELKQFKEKYKTQRQNEMMKHCETLPLIYGDKLIHDLCLFIIENEDCITRKAIIQAMRGTKVQLHVNIYYTLGTGMYNLLDEDYISHKIDDLIQNHVVYEKYIKNLDYSFYMIKPYPIAQIIANERYYVLETAYEKYHNHENLNDYECELIFHDIINQPILSIQDYLNLYKLCLHLQFFCANKSKILHIFHKRPENITKIFTMYYSNEKDKMIKKMIREILKS